MAGASTDEPTGRRHRGDEAWHQLGIPEEVLPAAVAAFHTPENAKRWLEVLNRFASRPEYLQAIAAAGLQPEDFVRWREAGLNAWSALTWPKRLTAAGLAPEDIKRWSAARLDLHTLPPLLPYLSPDLNSEEALGILTHWKGGSTEPTHPRAEELVHLLSNGLEIDKLRRLIASGFSGHEVYRWHSTGIPAADWSTWVAQEISPDKASKYFAKGVAPDTARQWINTGLSIRDAFAFIDLEASPAEAAEFTRSGAGPESLTRTEAGLEVIEEEPQPWDDDPVDQLPDVIEPGRISFTLWSTIAGGDPVAYDIDFTWDGRREAEWFEDISMANGNLSPASSSPITGTAAWPNGQDVDLTYDWSEIGKEGHAVLVGAAPTRGDPGSDQGARDPQQWIRLGEAILDFIYQEMG